MSELARCRLCGMHPVFVAENVLFHEHNPDKPCPLTTDHFSVAQWTALMGGGEPVEYQFYDPATAKWHGFLNDQHRRNTADAGYEIRALYTHPVPAVGDAVLLDAERYRWIKSNIKEEMLEGGNHDFCGHPGCKYVLPRIISYRDYCGIIPFDKAIDIARKREA